jgi:hypothetical protein
MKTYFEEIVDSGVKSDLNVNMLFGGVFDQSSVNAQVYVGVCERGVYKVRECTTQSIRKLS